MLRERTLPPSGHVPDRAALAGLAGDGMPLGWLTPVHRVADGRVRLS